MLRKLAVALVAATVFTAPVLAQGTPGTTAPATTSKVVAAKPTLESTKIKKGDRLASKHVKHVKHAKYVKHVKHAKYMRSAKSLHGAKHHVRHVVRKPVVAAHSAAASTAKPKSGTN